MAFTLLCAGNFTPMKGRRKFSGIILHRGVTKAKPFLSGSSMIMAGSADKKFVAYPIQNSIDEKGNQLINWIADLRVSVVEDIMPQDWNRHADKNKLLREFGDWHFDLLDVPSLISNAEAIYEFPSEHGTGSPAAMVIWSCHIIR